MPKLRQPPLDCRRPDAHKKSSAINGVRAIQDIRDNRSLCPLVDIYLFHLAFLFSLRTATAFLLSSISQIEDPFFRVCLLPAPLKTERLPEGLVDLAAAFVRKRAEIRSWLCIPQRSQLHLVNVFEDTLAL